MFKSFNSVFISVLFALYYILCCTFQLTPQVLTYVQSETDGHCNYSLYQSALQLLQHQYFIIIMMIYVIVYFFVLVTDNRIHGLANYGYV